VYLDITNGDLTANELARIQDAVTAVDAVTAPYGVAVQEVTDPTLADVTLNMDTTSAVGGYADGVLGCTTDAGQITIINGWNFYAGSDPTQIGSAQYDFETVVTHELGHALGLGHSTDSTSVMYATLNTGTVKRSLTTADLNVPDSDTTGACGVHAVVPAFAPLLAVQAFDAARPAPAVLATVVSLPATGTISSLAISGTPGFAPAESGNRDNAASPPPTQVGEGWGAEPVPPPPTDESLPALPPRPVEGSTGDAPATLAEWRAACTLYFADDSVLNFPESHTASVPPTASIPSAASDDGTSALDPAAAAAALAVLAGGYWRSPAELLDRRQHWMRGWRVAVSFSRDT
jgi:hypothetical protein